MGALSFDECAEMICEFGLTPNLARVYLAAVKLGIAQVSEVSKASKVRREDTYRALHPLEKLGLVEKISRKPTKIRALPMEEGLSVLIQHWKQTASEKEHSLNLRKDELLKQFKAYKQSRLVEENHFALILEKKAVIDRVMTMVKEAEKEIAAVTSAEELPHAFSSSFVGKSLETLNKKGVKTRIILELPEHDESLIKRAQDHIRTNGSIDLKFTYKPLSHYVIVDFKQVLIATSPQPSMGKLPYLWTDTASFAEVLQKHFEELWQTSVNLRTERPIPPC